MIKLVLFDIDGTLLDCHQCHDRAFARAFNDVYGINGRLTDIQFAGMTTSTIIAEVCGLHGVTAEVAQSKLEAAVTLMQQSLVECEDITPEGNILPGVTAFLDALQARKIPVGVYTGNPRQIGEILLAKSGLLRYFDLLTYGTEAENRQGLMRLSMEKAHTLLEIDLDSSEVMIVGDAVNDVQSGKAFGAYTVAVATGNFTREELEAHEPDLLLDNLADASMLLGMVAG